MNLKDALAVAEQEHTKCTTYTINESKLIEMYTALAVLAHEVRTQHEQLKRVHQSI